MSSLFDRLFKSQTQQQRFGKLYESFLKSKRRSRFQTEKTYRVKSSTSLIDKTKFLYDIPDSMIFPNTSDIDETEENADVFLKEFGDLLDKDYYLPESILNLLGLSHLIENNGNTEDQKSNEDSAKSADVSKSNQPNEFTNTTANKSSSRSVVSTNSNSSKNNSGNDFNDIMIKINSLKSKFNTNNDKQGMFGPPSKNIKKNIDSTSDPKTKNPSSNSNTTSTDELEIICETAPNTSKFSVIGTPKRRINFVKNRKSFPKICLPQRIKLGKKGARQVQDKGPNSLSDNIIQSTQRLIETQSINNKESDQIMTNSNVSNQNEAHSPSLLNKVAKVPTNTIKNNQVSQSLQNKVSNLSAKSMEHKPGKSKSPSPKKKKRKSIQSVDQNQMWKNVNMMFNHILDQMKINSEAHHMSVHNVAKFTGNNVIPNNLNEMENTAMFSIPPCDIIGNEAVDVNISSISHNTLDESRQELVSCITDPFYNQREELDKKPNVATNSNDNNKDEGPLSNTRRPVIFLKDPSLLLKEPETRTRKSDESTFIENASGAKDKGEFFFHFFLNKQEIDDKIKRIISPNSLGTIGKVWLGDIEQGED